MQHLRREYQQGELRREDLPLGMDGRPDPFLMFEGWFEAAVAAELDQPNAMTLATVDADGRPRARTVLLKDHGVRGYTFYTNTKGAKAGELEARPAAELLFHWSGMERQVRISGEVLRVPDDESLAYFRTRPRSAQIGAWASPQSEAIENRAVLEQRVADAESRFADCAEIPLPPHWGGYRVVPDRFEFWQGRESRLHDRFQFDRGEGGWSVTRLAP